MNDAFAAYRTTARRLGMPEEVIDAVITDIRNYARLFKQQALQQYLATPLNKKPAGHVCGYDLPRARKGWTGK